MLLLGGCNVANLGDELKSDFDIAQLWRRPTIALMSAPAHPAGTLSFENRQSRYILRDCAKSHLPELQAAECDVLVFELMREIRCALLRSGDAYLFDPNRMQDLVPDALPATERAVDVAALLGVSEVVPFDALDPGFFAVWAAHFARFHEAVLAPRIARGCIVIVQEVFMAKQTFPASDLLREHWAYCDAVNALLRRMYAHIAIYPGIERIGIEEALCLTAPGAPRGGIGLTHLLPEVFALMADQARAVIAPGREAVARSTFAHLMRRAGGVYDELAAMERQRHEQNLEILWLREQLDYRTKVHAWEVRRLENGRLHRRAGRLFRGAWEAVRSASRRARLPET